MAQSVKLTKEQRAQCQMITFVTRISYPNLFEPKSYNNDEKLKKEFSCTFLVPKTVKDAEGNEIDNPMMGTSLDGKPRSLRAIMKRAKVLNFGTDKTKWPKNLESPIRDGNDDDFKDEAGKTKEGYKDHWVIRAKSGESQRPGVVDADNMPITEPSVIYPGCYVRAYITAYVWAFGKAKGVGFILEGIQKVRDGKAFGSRKSMEQVFSPVVDDEKDENEDDDETGEGGF